MSGDELDPADAAGTPVRVPAPAKLVMRATGLVKRYGNVVAIRDSDFEVAAGEVLAVVGDNGGALAQSLAASSTLRTLPPPLDKDCLQTWIKGWIKEVGI